jgi:signal transduction histidine kinase
MSGTNDDPCLAAGGEAGALMRAIDWSKTSLGPVASWPLTLRTTVSIMLSSHFAMRIIWGPDFRFLYNDGYRPVLGASKHPSAMGSRTEESFPELWPIVGPMFRRVYGGETIALTDGPLPLNRNGYLEECYFTLSYSPLRDDEGRINGVLGVVYETTERVMAERRLIALRQLASNTGLAKTQHDACEQAVRTFESHPADAPFSLFYLLKDEKRAELVASGGLETNTTAKPDVIDCGREKIGDWPLQRCLMTLESVLVDDVELRFGAIHAGPFPEPIRQALILPLIRRGQPQPYGFWVAGVNPRHALGEQYRAFFELAADHVASALANAAAFQEERNRSAALLDLDRQKTAFFHNVSHEFRTPLTLILGPISDAMSSREQALGGAELASVHRNATRLLKLVNALLEFSRIEAGRVDASYQPTDLALLTRELAAAFESLAERAGLRLEIDCPPLPEPIYVDRDMWEKIVLNLLSNAFKFTFEGAIRVSLKLEGQRVVLRVSDTGVGIPASELSRLFERFHRVPTKRARTHEGTGIGLALVQELAKLHGGDVSVESEEGRGTTLLVQLPSGMTHLPRAQVSETFSTTPAGDSSLAFVGEASRWLLDAVDADRAPLPHDAALELLPVAARNARVLLVDDNADMRAYIRGILGPYFALDEATDGWAALSRARAQVPDLVLSDVMMPNLDGLGLLRELRHEPRTRAVPFILLSAQAGEEARIEGIESGADDYVIKPFSARELLARVRTHIELGRLRAKLETERTALAEAERTRLYSLLMQVPAGICVLQGPDHVYELANSVYLELIGDRDIVGKPLREALPEAASAVIPLLDEVYRTGEPFFGNEFAVDITRNGTMKEAFFNFIYKPVSTGGAEFERIVVVAFEVTAQVVARREAERLSQALATSNRDLDQFAYVASHDLKAPLRGIASLSQWIQDGLGDKLDAEGQGYLDMLRRRVHRLEALIDGILEYSRAGRVQGRFETIDVATLLAETKDLLAPRAAARVLIGTGMPTVTAERTPLQQVFLNLIGNALKHAGRDDVTVTVAYDASDNALHHFSVSDDGCGIAPQYHERIWGIFTTLESRDKVEGTGIGLAVVKKMVETRGGRVRLESDKGRGSTFHVYWPKQPRLST